MDYIAFITTFLFVAILPGANMLFALALGMSLGYKKSFYMMIGATLSVAIAVILVCIGVASIMVKFPLIFSALKLIGAIYMIYLSYNIYKNSDKFKLDEESIDKTVSNKNIFFQGAINSISNAGMWFFMISLIPPFLNPNEPVGGKIVFIVTSIGLIEFICLNIYVLGGSALKHFLVSKVWLLSRISAIFIFLIALSIISSLIF